MAKTKAEKEADAIAEEEVRRELLTQEERDAEDAVKGANENSKTDSKSSVVVSWKGNEREFSKEIHGADYKEIAKQFAEKFDGSVA